MKNTWAYADNRVSTNTADAHRITRNAKIEITLLYVASWAENQFASMHLRSPNQS